MAQIGSNVGMFAQSVVQTVDGQGNPIISSDNTFGASPAGSALLTQQLFGLPNASFDLIPDDPLSPIGNGNQVPYWDFANYSEGVMAGSAVYNTTSKNWSIVIYPGTAAVDSYVTFTTRSYLINDDNLGLRQKVFAVLEKSGTAAGTTQVNLTLSATYYDSADTALSTAIVGTALDTGTWTSISGFTTPGGSAIAASAHYVDIQFKVTATAAITGSVNFGIKSCLLASSVGALSSSSFVVTQTFTSSTTWTVPTGVTTLLAVAGVGAGGGGGGGGAGFIKESGPSNMAISGAGGGVSGGYAILKDVELGTATTVSVGIGAGGAGGVGGSVSKAAAGTANGTALAADASSGSDSTFGSFITFKGQMRGARGGITTNGSNAPAGESQAGEAGGTSSYFGIAAYPGTTVADVGSRGGSARYLPTEENTNGGTGAAALPLTVQYIPAFSSGSVGGSASSTGTAITDNNTGKGGASISSAPYRVMGGAGSGGAAKNSANQPSLPGSPGANSNAGSGGGASVVRITGGGSGTVTATGGVGGAGGNYGGGGGAGGLALVYSTSGTANFNARPIVATGGNGGAGGPGCITIVYVA